MTAEFPFRSETFDRRAIPPGATEGWWTAPDGHPIRRLDWPAPQGKSRGSVLFLPGRADFYEKYLETLDHWHGRGWQVTAVDWRGQGFSGQADCDEFTGSEGAYGAWTADLDALWRDWSEIASPPSVIVAHSMGAHIALRALAERRIGPAAVVLVAPMLGFKAGPAFRTVQHLAARLMIGLRGRHRPAWSGGERPRNMPPDRMVLLTHDRERYEDELWWRDKRPQLAMCPPSWGWIEASIDSMRNLEQAGRLKLIAEPVLILATRRDGLVSYGAIARAAARIPRARLVAYGAEARHEILRESDEVRNRALEEIDRFLDREAPAAG